MSNSLVIKAAQSEFGTKRKLDNSKQGCQAMAEGIMKIKKMELITLVIVIVLLSSLFVNSANVNNCDGLQYQVNYADWKLRQGGNSSYMKYWRQSRDGVGNYQH